jgi:hypothetical protein
VLQGCGIARAALGVSEQVHFVLSAESESATSSCGAARSSTRLWPSTSGRAARSHGRRPSGDRREPRRADRDGDSRSYRLPVPAGPAGVRRRPRDARHASGRRGADRSAARDDVRRRFSIDAFGDVSGTSSSRCCRAAGYGRRVSAARLRSSRQLGRVRDLLEREFAQNGTRVPIARRPDVRAGYGTFTLSVYISAFHG